MLAFLTLAVLTSVTDTSGLCTSRPVQSVEGSVRAHGSAECRIGDVHIEARAVATRVEGPMISLNIDGPVTVRRRGETFSGDGAIAMVMRVGDRVVLKSLTLTFDTDEPAPEARR